MTIIRSYKRNSIALHNYVNTHTNLYQIHLKKFLLYIQAPHLQEEQKHRLPPYPALHRRIQRLDKIPLPYSHPHKRGVQVENTPESVAAPNGSGTGWYSIAFHHDTVHTQEWRSYEPLGVDNSIRRRTMLRRRILCWVIRAGPQAATPFELPVWVKLPLKFMFLLGDDRFPSSELPQFESFSIHPPPRILTGDLIYRLFLFFFREEEEWKLDSQLQLEFSLDESRALEYWGGGGRYGVGEMGML